MSGQIQSGMPGASLNPILGDGWVQLGGTDSKKIFWDELSQADQSMVLQYLYFLSAQAPILPPPQQVITPGQSNAIGDVGSVGGVSAGSIAFLTMQKQHEIIMNMLDGWIKNIREIAAQSEKDYQKKVIEAMDQAFHTYKDHGNISKDPNFPLFSVGMIIVGTGVFQAMLPNKVDPAVSQIGINPVLSMYTHVIEPNVNQMVNLGMIGAIFGAGVQYFTVAEIAAKGTEGKEEKKGSIFAEGYAKNMKDLINSPSFNSYLMAIVTQNVAKGESISPEGVLERVAMVKMILLASALAILYQAEAGKMTGDEFAGMLDKTIKFEEKNIRSTLVNMILENLNTVKDPKVRTAILNSLLEFFDTDPSIETLSKPAELFKKLGEKLPRGDIGG